MIKITGRNGLAGRLYYQTTFPGQTIPEHYFEPGMIMRCTDHRERLVAKVHFEHGYKKTPAWRYFDVNGAPLHAASTTRRWSVNNLPEFRSGEEFSFEISNKTVHGRVVSQTSLEDMANVYLINDERTELYEIRRSILERVRANAVNPAEVITT